MSPPSPPEPLRIGVNDLPQARAVLAWAAAGRHGAVLLYGLDARFMGAGFWREVERITGRQIVVDCGDHLGSALVALRVGVTRLMLTPQGAQEPAFAALVAAHGAVREARGPWLRLAPGRPATAQLARARCERVTGPRTAGKDHADRIGIRPATGHLACD